MEMSEKSSQGEVRRDIDSIRGKGAEKTEHETEIY